jgi:hypothetical protein
MPTTMPTKHTLSMQFSEPDLLPTSLIPPILLQRNPLIPLSPRRPTSQPQKPTLSMDLPIRHTAHDNRKQHCCDCHHPR